MTKFLKEKIAKTKTIATRSMVAILGLLFGILITAQWRSLPTRISNPIAPYLSLKETKEALYQEQTDLKNEIKDLRFSIEQINNETENTSLTKNEIADLSNKKAKAGLTKVNGPGIIIVLNDSQNMTASDDSIIHAADLRDIINLLWGSGAEAISINDHRVIINTAIDCIVNTILVNNVRLTTPFQVEAIGNQSAMYNNINDQGMLSNIHKRKKDNGLIFEISNNNDITVPIFDGSFEVKSGE